MKVISIPDIHQHLESVKYIESLINGGSSFDYIVFHGDLVDDWESDALWLDHERNPVAMIERLTRIKVLLGDRFAWLLGNHDLSYLPSMYSSSHQISGHQYKHAVEIQDALLKALHYIQIAVKIDDVVYSHAGFTKTWVASAKSFIRKNKAFFDTDADLLDSLNKILQPELVGEQLYSELFDHRGFSPSGDDTSEGPLWARPRSVIIDNAFKKQVVGHTELKNPVLYKASKKELAVIDSREHNNFTTIVDGDLKSTGFMVQDIGDEQIRLEKLRRKRLDELSSYWFV